MGQDATRQSILENMTLHRGLYNTLGLKRVLHVTVGAAGAVRIVHWREMHCQCDGVKHCGRGLLYEEAETED